MNLRLPTRFVLLDKAIATVGSVGVDLYPDFNVFEVAKPYARVADARALHAAARARPRAARGLASSRTSRVELPYQIHDTLEQVRDGQIEVGFVHKGLDEFMHKLDVLVNRLVIALVVTGGLIGSSLIGIFADERPAHPRRARPLGVRLRALGRARRLAAVGRDPLRPALSGTRSVERPWPVRTAEDRSSQICRKGHLAGGPSWALASAACQRPSCSPSDEPATELATSSGTCRHDGFEVVDAPLRSTTGGPTSCSPATTPRSSAGAARRR